MTQDRSPLSKPEVLETILQQQIKRSAIARIILGLVCLGFCFVLLMNRASILERLDQLTLFVGVFSATAGAAIAVGGVKLLIKRHPLLQLISDLNDRVRKLEAKS
jgi:hypothetical protein